jgi:nucleotide-binding universal stress UspA family protein
VRRVLVAVEGDSESETLDMLASSLQAEQWPEIIALHVFEPDTLPMFADQPVHETDAWAQEFLHRVPHARHKHVRLEVRIGRAPDVVRNVSRELNVDMVVLSWRHDLGAGHAPIVREMLASSAVPLLLLPAAPQ